MIAATARVQAFVYKGLDVDVKGSVGETYDDNIAFSNLDRRKDYITNLIGGLGLRYEGKLRTFEMGTNVTHHLYAEHSDLDNTSEDLSFDFKNEFSRYDGFTLSDVFSHAYEPRSFEEALGRTSGRYSYYRNRAAFEYYRDVSSHLRLAARYGNDFDKLLRSDLKDSFLNRAGVGADYALSSRLSLTSSYEFSNRRFQPGRDATTHGLMGGFRYELTPQLTLESRAGADFIRSYNAREYTRPAVFASLADELDRADRASLSFTKETSANPYAEDIFNFWQVTGTYVRSVSRRLDSAFAAFYGEGEYPEAPLTDKLWGGSVSLTYAILEHWKGSVSYAYSSVDSTQLSRDYDRNAVFLGLILEY